MDHWPRPLRRPLAAVARLLLLLGCALGPALGPVRAGEGPPERPLPRLETGMHTAVIKRIATDSAGRWAVTASDDKTARVWEVATGRQILVLRPPQGNGNEGKLFAVALSPDGALVAVAGWSWSWSSSGTEEIYLFDRANGRLLRRLTGLPEVIEHLAFSRDGRWLAATLAGKNGVRVFDAASGDEIGRDTDYGGGSYSADFSPDGRRLVTTSSDGQVRLYQVNRGGLGEPKSARPGGGKDPFAARFSPDGRLIALGFADSAVVQVLDGETLAEVARPDGSGGDNGNLGSVAWSADGRYLLAGGTWDVNGKSPVRRWPVGQWSSHRDLPLTNNTIMDLAPVPGGGVLFAAHDPAWGLIEPDLRVGRRLDAVIADLRDQEDILGLSKDARRVRFGYGYGGKDPRSFDLAARALGPDAPSLAKARTSAPGLKVRDWKDRTSPSLNGRALKLDLYEMSRSLAIAPDGQGFVLGADWSLRRFDRTGNQSWERPVPGVAWAVNWSPDGRYLVAGYGDGTLRWHRAGDGAEVLALFPHTDRKRWVAWTPEGFYAASGPDAEGLMGYHRNHGKDSAGEFVAAGRLREHFYQPGLIARRLDADGDERVAEAVRQLGDVRELLAGSQGRAPLVELLSQAQVETDGEVQVRVRVRDQGGGAGRVIYRIDGVEQQGRQVGTVADGTESAIFTLPQTTEPHLAEIAVSALNERGVESQPVLIRAQVRPGRQAAPALWLLAVGVSDYQDANLHAGVRFAAADARAMARLFEERGPRLFRTVSARVLADREATGEAVRAAITTLAGQVVPQDVFVLYLAGHGASLERDYHFIPADALYTSAAALRARSLTSDQIRRLLAAIPAAKTVVLIDTCSAGGFGAPAGRGVGDKDAIDRLSRLTGRAMIAATADERMAFEGEGGHGAFTAALLAGLGGAAERSGNGSVEVRELADYVEEELPRITRKWGFEQYPFSSTEGNSFTLLPKP